MTSNEPRRVPEITTEHLAAVIRDAHERGWTPEQIATTLACWLYTQAGKVLTRREWGDPESRRAAANRLHELGDEIRAQFAEEARS